jgi:hypothetical protein
MRTCLRGWAAGPWVLPGFDDERNVVVSNI